MADRGLDTHVILVSMADLKAGKRARVESERGDGLPAAPREGSAILTDDKVKRISMPLRADDTVDVSSMREDTRDKIRRVLPQLSKDLGTSAGESAASTVATGLFSLQIIQLLEGVNALLLDKMGVPKDIIRDVAPYTEEQKTAVLDPLSRVLDKYLGRMFDSYGDEATLALVLVSIPMLKQQQAKTLMAKAKPIVVRETSVVS